MRTIQLISLILRILIAIIFLQTLYFKFTAHPDSVHIFSALGAEPYGRLGLGVIELITAVLIVISKTKIYGIIASFGIILGAIASHILVIGLSVEGDGGRLFLLAIIVLIASLILLFIYQKDIVILINKYIKQKSS